MATIEKRDLHLVKEALAIAELVIERQKGPMQASSDALDMKLPGGTLKPSRSRALQLDGVDSSPWDHPSE